jgi:hypothetical protein
MKNLVITVPIDTNLEPCLKEIAYRIISNINLVSESLWANDPDSFFSIFDGIGDEHIEYGFGLEITADKPVAGQRVSDRIT